MNDYETSNSEKHVSMTTTNFITIITFTKSFSKIIWKNFSFQYLSIPMSIPAVIMEHDSTSAKIDRNQFYKTDSFNYFSLLFVTDSLKKMLHQFKAQKPLQKK